MLIFVREVNHITSTAELEQLKADMTMRSYQCSTRQNSLDQPEAGARTTALLTPAGPAFGRTVDLEVVP